MTKTLQTFDPITEKNILSWLEGDYDEITKNEIERLLQENPKQLKDAFYTDLSFGTGGLRGMMGVGSNRMNLYTIRAISQGLANYLKYQFNTSERLSVILGHDSRHNSRAFAEETAKVMAGNGIQTFLFTELRPTPLVSFGCRLKRCNAGVMITASHNPPHYNGYKIYDSNGAQVLPPEDGKILKEIRKISQFDMICLTSNLEHPLIQQIDTEIDAEYVKQASLTQYYPEENQKNGRSLKIVYTSLHGTGITIVPKLLSHWGFHELHFVEAQVIPDGDFPTTSSPNPEEYAALSLGLDKMNEINGDILIATDPDADRVGVAIMHKGNAIHLTGNQVACLCLDHICDGLLKKERLPSNAAFIKTIATTELFKTICEAYDATCINVLAGFKHIAQKLNDWDHDLDSYQFIFGGEDSCGYLFGSLTRDKDGITASALICEIALKAKIQGKTLLDLLHDLYKKHGLFVEELYCLEFFDSFEGREEMHAQMDALRDNSPRKVCNIEVVSVEDYKNSIRSFLATSKTEELPYQKSDSLIYWLSDGSKILVRPSGTEPKIKIYCEVVKKNYARMETALKNCQDQCKEMLQETAFRLKGTRKSTEP